MFSAVAQKDTCCPCEFGVQPDHFYGECDFVDNALAGSVSTGKKFQIAGIVKSAVPVNVVNRFFGIQRASKFLFHYVAMLKQIARWNFTCTRNKYSDVAVAANALGCRLVGVVFSIAETTKQRPTSGAAQALMPIDGSSGLALYWHAFTTLNAVHIPIFISKFSAYSAAFCRAIHWVFAPFLAVSSNSSWFHGERRSANFTDEINGRNQRVGSTVNGFVLDFACTSAKYLAGVTRTHFELSSATLANLINRHPCFSFDVASVGIARVSG